MIPGRTRLSRRRWLAGLACAAAIQAVTAAAKERPYDTPPKPKASNKGPYLPPRAIAARLAGRVTVEFTVRENGTVQNPRVVASSGSDFLDLSAAKAVAEWQFEPARREMKPVKATVRQTLYFSAPSEAEAALALEEANKVPPLWVGRDGPSLQQPPGTKLRGSLSLLFGVDPDGWVHWTRLEKSSGNPDADFLVLASALSNWRVDLKKLDIAPREPPGDLAALEFGQPPANTVAFFTLPIRFQP